MSRDGTGYGINTDPIAHLRAEITRLREELEALKPKPRVAYSYLSSGNATNNFDKYRHDLKLTFHDGELVKVEVIA